MIGANELRAALTAGDFTDKTVSAALDVLREQEGLTLIQAVRAVYFHNQQWWDERNMRVAGKLMAKRSPIRHRMLELVRASIEADEDERFKVYLVAGDQRPGFTDHIGRDVDGEPFLAVVVGAVWIIEHQDDIDQTPEVEKWVQAVLNS